MEVLITSKTHKGKNACVGGLVVNSGQFVRLLNEGNWDPSAENEFNIGDIWNIRFTPREDIEPPYVEDVVIHYKSFQRKIENISAFIINSGVEIFRGSPYSIFNGFIRWTGSGSGFVADKNDLPPNSVGFWISDKDLILNDKHYEYPYQNIYVQNKRFRYVGYDAPVKIIPEGTPIRVSLARWWKPDDADFEERCYLQLSGWYL
jgi:hypothetical protein